MAIKIRLVVFFLAIGGLVAAGYFMIGSPVQAGSNNVHSTMVLLDAGPGPVRYDPFIEVNATQSKLTRGSNEIWVKINTRRLPPGASTNWWVVFNNTAGCGAGGCSGDDFVQDATGGPAETSVLWATGGVVGDDGRAEFEAHLEEGLANAPGQVLWGPGLTNVDNAEIHYIIRYHGPTNTNNPGETLVLMTTTVDGGCNNAGAMAGNFACWDPQATVFPFAK